MSQPDSRIGQVLAAAGAARQRGARDEERAVLDRALRTMPNDPHLLNASGLAALGAGDASRARGVFERVTALVANEPSLWTNLATACRALGDDEGERLGLLRAIGLDRLNFMAQLRLAELNQRTGQSRAASEGWAAVLQLAAGLETIPPAIHEALERGRAFVAERTETLASALQSRIGSIDDAGSGHRIRACIDHALGRRPIYHNQCAGLHFPFLPADEFFAREHFLWMADLEGRADAIRREALALIAGGDDAIRPYVRQESGTPDNKWSALDHSLDWSACFLWEYGVRNEVICAACPETAAALAAVPQTEIPGKAPTAFFSILRPRAHIPAHTGVTNTRTIVHLPLVVPDGCRFRVGGETRTWREGEAFAFDDTIEHEAWNDSDDLRVVLIFDVWNPYLTTIEQAQLRTVFDVVERT